MSEIDTEEDISMNKTQLKNFAVAARVALIERVKDRARGFGIDEKTCAGGAVIPSKMVQTLGGALLSQTEINQRDALLARIQSRGYDQVMEETAYTWFNRFIALRYMQEHNLLPVSVRVLPDAPGALPELVRQAQNVELDGVDFSHVVELLEGNRTETLYTELLIALCNQLSDVLPQMFEPISDYTELLFPDGLLREDSVLAMLAAVDAENWADIQVIGWLYQYYISQRHDEIVDINGGAIQKNDIPAATCLYTTDWVVQYMVENSLGRVWLEGHPDDTLRRQWRFYMDEMPQDEQTEAELAKLRAENQKLTPEQLSIFDPCMGSSHILDYAFDVLMDIYRTQGYTDRDATSSIVENNLFGLDIDSRAAQMASFCIMMQACKYDRRFLRRGIHPNVYEIAEWPENEELHISVTWSAEEKRAAQLLKDTFANAKEFGSMIAICPELCDLLEKLPANAFEEREQATLNDQSIILTQLLKQAKLLAGKYHAVVSNPPYMNKFSREMKKFIQENYNEYKSDLFAVFMYRNFGFCKAGGFSAFMSPFVWMFIKSYESLRAYILKYKSITTLIQMEYSAFEEATVPICTFVLRNAPIHYTGNYLRLSDFKGGMDVQRQKVLEAQETEKCAYRFSARQDNFEKIPGAPVAYWVSENFTNAYKSKVIAEYGFAKSGLQTGDNNRFLKFWQEVCFSQIAFGMKNKSEYLNSRKKWVPQIKGGEYRKWYGNFDYIVNWENDGMEIRKCDGCRLNAMGNDELFFRAGITWSHTTSSVYGARYLPGGSLFNVEAPMLFVNREREYYILAFLNSCVAQLYLNAINSTIHYLVGNISALPIVYSDNFYLEIDNLVHVNIKQSKTDWDSYETSWDFKRHPLI